MKAKIQILVGGNAPKDIDDQSVHLSDWVHLLRKGWAAGAIPDLVRTTGGRLSSGISTMLRKIEAREPSVLPFLFIIGSFLGGFTPK